MKNFYRIGSVHAYLKGILQSIYNLKSRCSKLRIARRYPLARFVSENNIAEATNCSFISQYAFDAGSVKAREILGTESRLVLDSCAGSSAVVRQAAEGQSKRCRTAAERVSNKPRTSVEAESNNTRTAVEENKARLETSGSAVAWLVPASGLRRQLMCYLLLIQPTNSRETAIKEHRISKRSATEYIPKSLEEAKKQQTNGRESVIKQQANSNEIAENKQRNGNAIPKGFLLLTRYIPVPNLIWILFYLRASLHRMCTAFFSSLHREKDCASTLQVLCNYEETYKRVKTRLKESTNPLPTMYCLSTVNVLERYRKGTTKVLESYQRATNGSTLTADVKANPSQVQRFNRPSIAQACVKHCICIDKAWIVCKSVPIHALSTLYERSIYASSILNPYLKSALSQISVFKRLKSSRQVFDRLDYDSLLESLKRSVKLIQGGGEGVGNKVVVRLFSSPRFSIVSILLLLLTFGTGSSQAQSKQHYVLQGTVVSAVDKKPLQGVSVRVEAEDIKVSSKKDGSFSTPVAHRKGKVKLTYVGYKTVELEYTSGVVLSVQLSVLDNQLDEVEVVSTGYQKIPKERATGSFEFVDNKLLNQRVGSTILDRLENASVSIKFTKDYQFLDRAAYNDVPQYQFNIRGNSKMIGDAGMTIVLDNVVYEGDPRNINPNDIESVTILKDAVAVSIWGTSAGDGVIVLTSKKGKYNAPFSLSFNSNITVVDKPDIYALPFMKSSDFIEYESFLFGKGYFDRKLKDKTSYPTMSPVVELLDAVRQHKITQAEVDRQIEKYKEYDIRDDYRKYVYRSQFNQQYALNISGGNRDLAYSLSMGHDNNKGHLEMSTVKRTTLRSSLKARLVKDLEITADLAYSNVRSSDNSINSRISYGTLDAGGGGRAWPYLRLVDEQGNPRQIELATYKKIYRDTAGNGQLLDWSYNPLAELHQNSNTSNPVDLSINLALKYTLFSKLNLQAMYAHQSVHNNIQDWMGLGSYAMRNIINLYTRWNDHEIIKRPVPVGDRLYDINDKTVSHMGRFQADYSFVDKFERHKVDVMTGAEIRQRTYLRSSYVMYGFNKDNLSHIPVDFVSLNPILNRKFGGNAIEDLIQPGYKIDRYLSYYGNVNYAYKNRYMFSGSVRQDASNLFGVKSNNKWQPLWSAGVAWLIHEEPFYTVNWLSSLKLRATYGYAGKSNTSSSGFPILYYSGSDYTTGLPYATLSSPSNPSLRWEKINTVNVALDFAVLKNRINGSFEWYRRRSMDLLTSVPIDATKGYESILTNGGELDGKGIELTLNSTNIKWGEFSWLSSLLLSRNRTKVAKYYYKYPYPINYAQSAGTASSVMMEGHDVGAVFAFRSAGLDHETGNPIGYEGDVQSTNYNNIVNGSMDNIRDVGPGIPVFYGSLGNEFNYRNFSLKVNLQARWGHYFFRKSFSDVKAAENRTGHADYSRRWRKPGDELFTVVPSVSYPLDSYRGDFFNRSEVLVEKGDNLRLQDIHLSYRIASSRYFKNLSVYAFAKNLNVILWRANKLGIDPEYRDAVPYPLSISLGVNIGI